MVKDHRLASVLEAGWLEGANQVKAGVEVGWWSQLLPGMGADPDLPVKLYLEWSSRSTQAVSGKK